MMVHFDFIDACCSKSVVAGIDGSNIHWRDNERGRYLCRIHSMLCFSFQSNLSFCKHLLSRFLTMMIVGHKWADMVDDNQMDQMVDDQMVAVECKKDALMLSEDLTTIDIVVVS